MLGKILGIPWLKIGYFLQPEFTGKSLFISGNLPITGNSTKTVNINALVGVLAGTIADLTRALNLIATLFPEFMTSWQIWPEK